MRGMLLAEGNDAIKAVRQVSTRSASPCRAVRSQARINALLFITGPGNLIGLHSVADHVDKSVTEGLPGCEAAAPSRTLAAYVRVRVA